MRLLVALALVLSLALPAQAEKITYPYEIVLRPGESYTITNSPHIQFSWHGKSFRSEKVEHGIKIVGKQRGQGTIVVYSGSSKAHEINVIVLGPLSELTEDEKRERDWLVLRIKGEWARIAGPLHAVGSLLNVFEPERRKLYGKTDLTAYNESELRSYLKLLEGRESFKQLEE